MGKGKYTRGSCYEVKAIGRVVKEFNREVKQLTETNQELRDENKRLLLRLEKIEQYQRANNVEIKSVPLKIDPDEVVK